MLCDDIVYKHHAVCKSSSSRKLPTPNKQQALERFNFALYTWLEGVLQHDAAPLDEAAPAGVLQAWCWCLHRH